MYVPCWPRSPREGECNRIGGVLFAIEDFIGGRFKNNPKPLICDETSFGKLCENLQNCLHSSSFFLFHDMKSKCGGISFQSASNNKQMDPQEVAFTENYDIATYRFKSIVDEDVANLTATSEEINEKQFQFGTHGNALRVKGRGQKCFLSATDLNSASPLNTFKFLSVINIQ